MGESVSSPEIESLRRRIFNMVGRKMEAAMEYGQLCPLAKATEILAERWTFLVIRELLSGAVRFNQIRRGMPLMSPSLL